MQTPQPKIGILERNRNVGQRIARVFRASAQSPLVVLDSDPEALRRQLGDAPTLLACDETDVDRALEWAQESTNIRVMAWTIDRMERLVTLADDAPNLVSLLAWPSFASMPRSWELLLAMTRVIDPSHRARFGELLDSGAKRSVRHPRTSTDRDVIVSEVSVLAERVGAGPRSVQSVGEVAHEMLMNAMYDAPVDQYGTARYASDRKQQLTLMAEEIPAFSFGTDGTKFVMSVRDPFGGLRRAHLTEGLGRGLAAKTASDAKAVLNTENGGAGLGLFRMYALSSALMVDVAPGSRTTVTAWIDLDLTGRDARSIPSSIHFPVIRTY
jgi:hypothetical protein